MVSFAIKENILPEKEDKTVKYVYLCHQLSVT